MGFLDWLKKTWDDITNKRTTYDLLSQAESIEEMQAIWDALPDTRKLDPLLQIHYNSAKAGKNVREFSVGGGLEMVISDAITAWQTKIEEFQPTTPEAAKAKIAAITADVVKLGTVMTAADIAFSKLPWIKGEIAASATRRTLTWLGFGAIIAAVAHDPVKIGMLRPYQDALEMTFRNRRPDDNMLFQAYRTRELAPEKVEDLRLLDDEVMNRIEKKNDEIYFSEISRWGYSENFATALSRSATRTLNFSQLTTLARAGIYDRGFAIYSLWGEGLDRVCMPAALDALETLRDREMYSGFRSMIEPSYVDGLLTEQELIDYWTLAGVPEKVQKWVLPRMKKRREAAKAKAEADPVTKERDLTLSQITGAFVDGLIDRVRAVEQIRLLGYDADETELLVIMAEQRIKTPSVAKLKRLPLSDYEKAYKHKLISLDAVLLRMKAEYDPLDIDLEQALLRKGVA